MSRFAPASAASTLRTIDWQVISAATVAALLVAVAIGVEIPQGDMVALGGATLALLGARAAGWPRRRRAVARRAARAGALIDARGATASRTAITVAGERAQTLSLLQATLESTTDAIVTVDQSGRIVTFNQTFLCLWGLEEGALTVGDDAVKLAAIFAQAEDSQTVVPEAGEIPTDPGAAVRDEVRLRDGRVLERYTRPHRSGERTVGRIWSFRDVTGERAAVAALRQREAQLAEAQRLSRTGSWEWDLRTGVIDASDELWRISGYEPGSFVWTLESYLLAVHPADREAVADRIAASVHTLEPFDIDNRIVCGDGAVRFVSTRGQVSVDAGGKPVRLFGTVQDIDERRLAGQALERKVRIEQALTQVSRMFASSTAPEMGRILGLLGQAVGADRAYIFQAHGAAGSVVMNNTNEWCAPGVPSRLSEGQGIGSAPVPWLSGRLEAGASVVVQSLAQLPAEAATDRAALERRGVTSLAAVPIRDPLRGLTGVLGFDYVVAQRVPSDEDVRVLQTTAEMLVAHFAREQAELEILQRDAILRAMSFAAERFLRTNEWDQDLQGALARIGSAAKASRAYLFESSESDGRIYISQRAEWSAPGITSQLENPALQNVRLRDLGLGRWEKLLLANQPVQELVCELPPDERVHLEQQQIRSILLIPIFVGDSWWGFLGFDDCRSERAWTAGEREVLMAAGGMIGAAIQRRHGEAALRESEFRFSQLSDNIPEVFFMAAVDLSQVLYLSRSFERVWGRSVEDAYANPILFIESILPEDRAIVYADVDQSGRGAAEAARHIDYRIRRPDGAVRWIRNRLFQIPDANGDPYRIAGVCSDITEQKQMEEELRRASRIEAIGHLAAGIAHEINTPIQYIGDNVRFLDNSYADVKLALDQYRGLLNEALAGELSASRLAEIAEVIRSTDLEYVLSEAPRATSQALDGVARVAEIVRAMKEFSHPGTGQRSLTDLNHAIRSTTTVARNEWKYVAELVTKLDDSLPLVNCHAGELNQAILNLVVNAAHSITDRQQREGTMETGLITVSTSAHGGFVEIRVGDTGTGIPEDIQPRIFDPFFTTKEVGRGTGQGLTFVHTTVVEKHGGTIAFETEPGVGTTFIVRLPHVAMSHINEAA